MKTGQKAFTIIELLIVIVVIGILAAIVIVAYNGVITKADNARRLSTLKQWSSMIQTYRAENGSDFIPTESPTLSYDDNAFFCLGENFPDDNSCWNSWDPALRPSEAPSLIQALKTLSSIPTQYYNDTNLPDGFGYGPVVEYEKDGSTLTGIISIMDWFHGTTCPPGTTYTWSSDEYNVATCMIELNA